MPTWCTPLDAGGRGVARFTIRAEGDFRIDAEPAGLEARRRAVVDRPWVWLHQVHGAEVVAVRPGDDVAELLGRAADAVVTDRADLAVAVQVADCAPIALVSPQGVMGAVHAGWRGLEAGVVVRAVDAMRGLGADRIEAWRGPCIHAECYEFGPADLDRLATSLGPWVRGRTRTGAPALDLPAAVDRALADTGVHLPPTVGAEVHRAGADCTACSDPARFFSHRARGDVGRHAMVVWLEQGSPPA